MEFKDLKPELISESYLKESGFLWLSVEEEVVEITPHLFQFYN